MCDMCPSYYLLHHLSYMLTIYINLSEKLDLSLKHNNTFFEKYKHFDNVTQKLYQLLLYISDIFDIMYRFSY